MARKRRKLTLMLLALTWALRLLVFWAALALLRMAALKKAKEAAKTLVLRILQLVGQQHLALVLRRWASALASAALV